MSGGKACGKQAAQYTGKQPGEWSGATSRDAAAAEDEVHSPGHTHTTRQATQTQPALLAELQALHQTHREATRLFFMAASQGGTDTQRADALRHGLPHLTDPASLQDQNASANSLRRLAYEPSEARKNMSRRRGRAPRVNLRRRKHCCSPLTPLLQLWKPSPLRTGAGLGRLAGRSC